MLPPFAHGRPLAGVLAFLSGLLLRASCLVKPRGEALRWPVGLARRPKEAGAFYVTLAVATAGGTVLNFLPFDPMRALYWSAVINGIMVAPIIIVMMKLATNHRVMARFTLSPWLRVIGWLTAIVIALCVVGLIVSAVTSLG
jgi:Mn2+/Fe2+ NRAMP family transporter